MITLEPYRKETEKQYRALYLSAFPKEERAPWWLLKRRAKQGRAEALAAMDDGRFAGMAYVVTLGDMAYLFYLAVEEGQRGRGTGGKIIAALRERFPDKRIYGDSAGIPRADKRLGRETSRAVLPGVYGIKTVDKC